MAKTRRAAKTEPAAPASRIRSDLLDARRDRLDLRDRPYQPPLRSLPDQFPPPDLLEKERYLERYIAADLILDQGVEGACTGFGLACVVNYLLFVKGTIRAREDRVSPRMIYHLARLYDEWPGEDYDGSSCRGALKGWHKHGVCRETLWPYFDPKTRKERFVPPKKGFEVDAIQRTLGVYYRIDKTSVVDMQAAIQEIGAIYCSGDVHAGWEIPAVRKDPEFANLPEIKFRRGAPITGGHAFALVGYDKRGFVLQNSWGRDWGLGGFAILTYEDWVEHGFDTWACALGVPKLPEEATSQVRKAFVPQRALSDQPRRAQVAFSFTRAGAADATAKRLSEDTAYERTLVFGNDGYVERRVVAHEDVRDTVSKIGNDIPSAWFDEHPSEDGKDRLVIYAHGGLNNEASSLRRVRALGQVFEDNGVYPLFLTWKTGFLDSLLGILEDKLAEIAQPAGGAADFLNDLRDAAIEAKDRALEVASRKLLVRALWEQMKQNAEAASLTGKRAVMGQPGAVILCEALRKLAARRRSLEIHLVGHSAGSILLGHMLQRLPGRVASCSLYAPACTVEFANATFAQAVRNRTLEGRNLRIHVLADSLEKADSVGPYGKSLLYLVSRALEPVHKTPILGLAKAFDPAANGTDQWNEEKPLRARFTDVLETWQAFWRRLPGGGEGQLVVEKEASVKMGFAPGARTTPAVHGCFDNHAAAIADTIALINGRPAARRPMNLDY